MPFIIYVWTIIVIIVRNLDNLASVPEHDIPQHFFFGNPDYLIIIIDFMGQIMIAIIGNFFDCFTVPVMHFNSIIISIALPEYMVKIVYHGIHISQCVIGQLNYFSSIPEIYLSIAFPSNLAIIIDSGTLNICSCTSYPNNLRAIPHE